MSHPDPGLNQTNLITNVAFESLRGFFEKNGRIDREEFEERFERVSEYILRHSIKELHCPGNLYIGESLPYICPFIIAICSLRKIVQGQVDIELRDGRFGCLVLEDIEALFGNVISQPMGSPNSLSGVPFISDNAPRMIIAKLESKGALHIGSTKYTQHVSSARLVSQKYATFAISQTDHTITEHSAAVYHNLYSLTEIIFATSDPFQRIKYQRMTITARSFSDIESIIGFSAVSNLFAANTDENPFRFDSDTGEAIHEFRDFQSGRDMDYSAPGNDLFANPSDAIGDDMIYGTDVYPLVEDTPGLGIYTDNLKNANLPVDNRQVKVLLCFKVRDRELDSAIYKIAQHLERNGYDCVNMIRSRQSLQDCRVILRASFSPRLFFRASGPHIGVPAMSWSRLKRALEEFQFIIAPAGQTCDYREFSYPSSMTIPIYKNNVIEIIGNQKYSLFEFGGRVMKILKQEGYINQEVGYAPFYSVLSGVNVIPYFQ